MVELAGCLLVRRDADADGREHGDLPGFQGPALERRPVAVPRVAERLLFACRIDERDGVVLPPGFGPEGNRVITDIFDVQMNVEPAADREGGAGRVLAPEPSPPRCGTRRPRSPFTGSPQTRPGRWFAALPAKRTSAGADATSPVQTVASGFSGQICSSPSARPWRAQGSERDAVVAGG